VAARQQSPDQLFRRIEALPTVMAAAQRQVAEEAGRLIVSTTERRIMDATGGDGVLSGMTRTTKGRRSTPRPMGASSKIEPSPTGARAFVRARGAVHLVEHDIARHVVVSRWAQGDESTREDRVLKSGAIRKGRATNKSRIASVEAGLGARGGGRRAVLNLGGGTYRRWTTASSKGRQPWKRGVDDARPQLAEIQARAQRAAIRSALR